MASSSQPPPPPPPPPDPAIPTIPSQPSDIELAKMLRARVDPSASPPSNNIIIHDADVYAQDPADLTQQFAAAVAEDGQKAWYFSTKLEPKSQRGKRKRRCMESGVWKGEGKSKDVIAVRGSESRAIIGHRSLFSFVKKVNGKKEARTGWIMHEFRLSVPDGNEESLVALCKVFRSSHRCATAEAQAREEAEALVKAVEEREAAVKAREEVEALVKAVEEREAAVKAREEAAEALVKAVEEREAAVKAREEAEALVKAVEEREAAVKARAEEAEAEAAREAAVEDREEPLARRDAAETNWKSEIERRLAELERKFEPRSAELEREAEGEDLPMGEAALLAVFLAVLERNLQDLTPSEQKRLEEIFEACEEI